ncbi:MAG: tRNA pseudouridine(55) synthase TruB [Phycisphaeraceae bacterium]
MGLLVVDKPLGLSSMDVVRRVRKAARGAKTGHAGTLDPLATGILVCCLGKATRFVESIMGLPKTYVAEVDLSAFTASDDRESEREELAVPSPPDRAAVEAACEQFVGEIEQAPPAHSAVKVGGRRAYKLARQGKRVEMPTRTVVIYEMELLEYDWPIAKVRIHCGRGTYIRSLARDLGKVLGTGGHLASLCRTAVGPYDLDKAVQLDRVVEQGVTPDDLLPPPEAGG